MKTITPQSVISRLVKSGYNESSAKRLVLDTDSSGESRFDYVTRVYGADITNRFAADVLSTIDWDTYNN